MFDIVYFVFFEVQVTDLLSMLVLLCLLELISLLNYLRNCLATCGDAYRFSRGYNRRPCNVR